MLRPQGRSPGLGGRGARGVFALIGRRAGLESDSNGRGKRPMNTTESIHESILDAVGGTPMVRLSRIGRDLPCELLGKCEFMNPGGSVKDRIGVRMVLEAEREGRIHPGDTLIEPTSGNTGIGLALAAAVRGYRLVITMPEKMSHEKQVVLEALGAEIIRTPTEAAWDAPESHIGVAKRLNEVIPNSHVLDQYSNPNNPLAHEMGTGPEIWEQCGGRLDAVVMAAGTGGGITGVARYLKNMDERIEIIGVDPVGSILAGPEPIKSYKVEGIGYDFIPDVLDRSLVDRWIKTNDGESFRVARQLIRQEGLLVGGSSGSAAWAALKVCRDMAPGKRVVVVLPDSVRNYLTKFVDDAWMRRHGFLKADWEMGSIADIVRAQPKHDIVTVEVTDHVRDVVALFKKHGISQLPVLDQGRLAGILTETDVLEHLVWATADSDTSVAEVMVRRISTVSLHASASELPQIFERGEVAIVVDDEGQMVALITKLDLIDLLAGRKVAK
jgi:cystathionine beta-synthase